MEAYSTLSDVYDRLMNDVSYEKWVDYILKLLVSCGVSNDAKIIDAGCGTGSVAVALSGFGFQVTGVDASQNMLNVAEAKARKAGVDIRFVCQDLTDLTVHKPVDVVNASCDVANYIAPERMGDFFKAVFSALKPNGIFLFDISSDYKLSKIIGNNIFFEDDEEVTYIWQNRLERDRVNMDITLFKRKNDVFYRSDEQHTQYIHNIKQLQNKLIQTGFNEISVYECFGFQAPKKDSQRIQFCAK